MSITTDLKENLDEAYTWVLRQRKSSSANSDIWSLSLDWKKVKFDILRKVKEGRYRLESVKHIRT